MKAVGANSFITWEMGKLNYDSKSVNNKGKDDRNKNFTWQIAPINKVKRQITTKKKIFTTDISDKAFLSQIC